MDILCICITIITICGMMLYATLAYIRKVVKDDEVYTLVKNNAVKIDDLAKRLGLVEMRGIRQ